MQEILVEAIEKLNGQYIQGCSTALCYLFVQCGKLSLKLLTKISCKQTLQNILLTTLSL